MAVFLHGSLMHIAFNMWVLMDIGPILEELYGSARYLFIYVMTGIGGYVLSSFLGHYSVGASGALLGLIGVLLALTMGRKTHDADVAKPAHPLAGLHCDHGIRHVGYRQYGPPGRIRLRIWARQDHGGSRAGSPEERKKANLMGWAAALVVAASLGMMIFFNIALHVSE